MNEPQSSESPASVQKPSNKTGVIILFVIVVFLLVAGIVSLYLWTENQSSQDTTTMPTQPVTLPSVMPTESPASSISGTLTPAALDPSAAQVRVLNGSGTAGSAQQVAASLRTAGFTNVTVGNANSFAYEGITIQVTADSSGYLPMVREAIASDDPTAEITTAVDETILGDVVVIVGQ